MPGLYIVITRAPGTLITGLIYNGDHQAHVDGRDAESMQAFGVSLDQMNVTQSPFAADNVTEVLPVAVSNELAVIRFVISSIKALLSGTAPTPNWWQAISAPALAAVGARVVRGSSQTILDNTQTTINFTGGSADFNSGVWSSGSPTRFTAPFAGLYYACAAVRWEQDTVGFPITLPNGSRQLNIGVNGVFNFGAKGNSTEVNREQFQTVSGLLKLAASDFVEFSAFQTSGVTLHLLTDGTPPVYSPMGALVYFGSTL